MVFSKLKSNSRLKTIGVSFVFSLGALFLSATASASLVVIGSKDIHIDHLTSAQLSAIFLDKGVSLSTGEALNPIDQDPNSKIYAQFYGQVSGMDASSVNSYWSGLVFSGAGNQPAQVEGDRAAIASVENSSKEIAYVDSNSLGAQVVNVKILNGTVPQQSDSNDTPAPSHQSNSAPSQHHVSNEQLRQQLNS